MLVKLIKYNVWFASKPPALMSLILCFILLTALLGRVTGIAFIQASSIFVGVIATITYVLLFIVFTSRNIYGQFSGKESYLSYMLPVSAGSLVASQMISALLTAIYGGAALSLFWYLFGCINPSVAHTIQTAAHAIVVQMTSMGNSMALFVAFIVAAMAFSFCGIALSVTATALPALRNRGLGVPVAVVGWYMCGQLVGLLLLGTTALFLLATGQWHGLNNLDGTGFASLEYIGIPIYTIASVLCYWFMVRIVKSHHAV